MFKNLGIEEKLVLALQKEDITIPTEIQNKVIPIVLGDEGKDLLVRSPTGTGKTLAYLLPLFQKIDVTKSETQALILVPTHELAIQVIRVIDMLNNNSGMNILAQPIIGNVNITRQIEGLKKKPNIIVGSSGRILELIKKKKILAHQVKTIILDEGDKLLDENHFEGVQAVVKTTLKDRNIWLFSATLSSKATDRAKEIMKETMLIEEEEKIAVPKTIEHLCFVGEERDKIDIFRKVYGILKPQKSIVFVHKGFDTNILLEKLKYHKLSVQRIIGDAKKLERKKVMEDFKNGKIDILIATDIAARGIDVVDITHIFNIDLPQGHENYLHRCGRTGRDGKEGMVVSIVTDREMKVVKIFEKKLKVKIAQKDMFKGVIIDSKTTKKRPTETSIKVTGENSYKLDSKTTKKRPTQTSINLTAANSVIVDTKKTKKRPF